MITLKLILDPSQWLEVTWSEVTTTPDQIIPAKEAEIDEDGNVVTAAKEEQIIKGETKTEQLYCQSYHPTQIQMLQDKAAEFNTALTAHDTMLIQWVADYVPPPAEPIAVPQVITIRQAKLALLAAGLLDDVDTAVAAADRATQIEWEYATEVHRSWPTLSTVQTSVGLTNTQVDDLFIAAAVL